MAGAPNPPTPVIKGRETGLQGSPQHQDGPSAHNSSESVFLEQQTLPWLA